MIMFLRILGFIRAAALLGFVRRLAECQRDLVRGSTRDWEF
jgi:hypothetical protein